MTFGGDERRDSDLQVHGSVGWFETVGSIGKRRFLRLVLCVGDRDDSDTVTFLESYIIHPQEDRLYGLVGLCVGNKYLITGYTSIRSNTFLIDDIVDHPRVSSFPLVPNT